MPSPTSSASSSGELGLAAGDRERERRAGPSARSELGGAWPVDLLPVAGARGASRGPRRRRVSTPSSTSSTRCFGVPSKSKAFGSPRGSSASSASEKLLVEDLLADPAGDVAALLEQPERAERVVRRSSGAARRSRTARAPRGTSRARARPRRACASAFSAASRAARRRVDVADPPGRALGVARTRRRPAASASTRRVGQSLLEPRRPSVEAIASSVTPLVKKP